MPYTLVAHMAAHPSTSELVLHAPKYMSSHDIDIVKRCAKMAFHGTHGDNYGFIVCDVEGTITIERLGMIKVLGGVA